MKNLIFLFLFTMACSFAQKNGPKVSVSPESFDFGSIKEGSIVNKEFIVKNEGTDTLKISRVRASCGCTAANPKKTVLAPGEETSMNVTFNSARRAGQQKKHVYIMSNDLEQPEYRFTFTANVIRENSENETSKVENPKLKFQRTSYDFGKVREGQKLNIEIGYENLGKQQLVIFDVKSSCDCLNVILSEKKLESGKKGKIRIELDTKGRKGAIARTITVAANDPQNPQQTITLFVNILENKS